MPKRLSAAVDVGADVESTWRALTGAAWPAALAEHLRDDSRLVSLDEGDGAVLVVSRKLPEGIPGYLQKFLPADGRVTQTDSWGRASGGVRRGTWDVGYAGSPGSIGGDLLVEPTPGGSRWVVTGQVQIRVPLVGGRVEGYLAPLVEKLVVRQGEVLRDLLG